MQNVKLIAYTPDAEKIVASAAKLCYSKTGVDEIMDNLDNDKTKNFLDMLLEIGHESPIEHVSFTFAIEGVSRALLAQITRHRLASYSVRSQRYVKEGAFEYIIPPEIEAIKEAADLYREAMAYDQAVYDRLSSILEEKYVSKLAEEGKDSKQARLAASKKAIEDARFVLPNACETKMVVTMNARSLLNFFNQRCCERAQWEIRSLATSMLWLVKEVAPTLFKYAGPKCLIGPCPEGKMSCGKQKKKRKEFLNL
jgi:thymidylate synthase (FAD)